MKRNAGWVLIILGLLTGGCNGQGELEDSVPTDGYTRTAYIIGNHSDFTNEVATLDEALSSRHYSVVHFPPASPDPTYESAAKSLMKATEYLTPTDQVVLSFQCHGSDGVIRPSDDFEKWEKHGCCVTQECEERLHADDIVAIATAIQAKGARLVVMDTSCSGGNTVQALEQALPSVCAISSTGTNSPALTGFPDFGHHILNHIPFTRPYTFYDLAGWGETQILQRIPGRSHQRAYMSGCTGSMPLREWYTGTANSIAEWGLRKTQIIREIYPEKEWPKVELELDRALASNQTWREGLLTVSELYLEEAALSSELSEFTASFADQFTKSLAHYRDTDIPTPTSEIKDLPTLVSKMRKSVQDLVALRDQLEPALRELESTTAAKRRSDLTSVARGLIDRIPGLKADMSRLYNLYEEVECPVRKSPCADIQI
jgi:hypothetical protein